MSTTGTRVTDAHFDYIRARTIAEDELLAALRVAAVDAGLPEIHIAAEQGAFLQVLVAATGAREVVEVGTLGGYSAIWMARGLPPEGRVRSIEFEPRHAAFAESWIARSDVAGMIEVHRGDARDVLPRFGDGSADVAFIDADKAGYERYLQECMRILRPGGLLLVDNAFAFGQILDAQPTEEGVETLRAFNDRMAATPGLRALIVPIGDGCWVGVKDRGRGARGRESAS